MKNAIIVDIDGTLADISHRRHYVASKPKNWKAFNAAMHLDGFHAEVALVIRSLWMYEHDRNGNIVETPRVLLASGRGEETRKTTLKWLQENNIWQEVTDPNWVYPEYPIFTFDKLYMRPAKDHRADDIVKQEILDEIRADGYNPIMAFDDRDRVVAMWRKNGIRCFQVEEGNF